MPACIKHVPKKEKKTIYHGPPARTGKVRGWGSTETAEERRSGKGVRRVENEAEKKGRYIGEELRTSYQVEDITEKRSSNGQDVGRERMCEVDAKKPGIDVPAQKVVQGHGFTKEQTGRKGRGGYAGSGKLGEKKECVYLSFGDERRRLRTEQRFESEGLNRSGLMVHREKRGSAGSRRGGRNETKRTNWQGEQGGGQTQCPMEPNGMDSETAAAQVAEKKLEKKKKGA